MPVPLEVVGNLEVVDKYKEIMKASTDSGSIYLKAKETIEAYAERANLTNREKADAMVNTVSTIATAMASKALDAAIKISIEDRDAVLNHTKLREEIEYIHAQRDKMDEDKDLVEANKKLINAKIVSSVIEGWRLQAAMRIEDGVNLDSLPAIEDPILPSVAVQDKGTKYEQMQQVKSSVYATFAKSYRSCGAIKWTEDPITGKIVQIREINPNGHPNLNGLIKAQTDVAIRQEKTFDDNMAQHVMNSSSTLFGMLMSAGKLDALNNGNNETLKDGWRSAMEYLNDREIH